MKVKRIGIVILGHGSKRKVANKQIAEVINQIKPRLISTKIVPAYLQFCRPTLKESVRLLVKRDCKTIIVVPFFLFMGNHVKRDIPKAIKNETIKYPELEFIYAESLGKDTRIAEIVLGRIKKVMNKW